MHAYDTKDLERLFGLPASTVRALARAGNIQPVRRAGRLHYSFHDLVVLRTASTLRAANIPSQRINRTLRQLRAALPTGSALNGVSLTALGNRIAIREGQTLREPDSGQYALALQIIEEKGRLHVIARQDSPTPPPDRSAENRHPRGSSPVASADARHTHGSSPMGSADARHTHGTSPVDSADAHYAHGFSLEDTDPQAAREAYQACLKADPNHLEARINLGRLLHIAGNLEGAEQVYRAAAEAEPLLAFNLGVLLDDLGREPDAIVAYREALALDPELADAHFNLARLYERARDPQASLRHLLAYRRMIDRQGT
jgi:tetratricopeptide (TPR) repeat protein